MGKQVGKLKAENKGKEEEKEKAKKGIEKREQLDFQYTFPQIKIKSYRAICLLKKLSSMTVPWIGKNLKRKDVYGKVKRVLA